MHKLIRLAGVAALIAAPAMLVAQSAKPVTFGVSGGLSLPSGDLGDEVESGFLLAGHVWFAPVALKRVGFRADVSYDGWRAKVGDLKSRSLAGTANVILHPSAKSESSMAPYLLGGVGLYNAKTTLSTSSVSTSSTDLGIQVGGGVEFKLSGFSTFAEAKYVNVFGDPSSTNWIPISFGIRF